MQSKRGIDYNNKVLQVRNLKTYFKVGMGKQKIKVKAVDDISFDVYKREVFGLVGESGCGKTTASRTIIRLYRPTDGIITFEDKVIGSGHNEFYKKMKYEKIRYRTELIKTDSRKKAILEIEEKYASRFKEIEKEKLLLEKAYEKDQKKVKKSIEDYKVRIFEEKNTYRLQQEQTLYEFTTQKDQLYRMTINETEIEYNNIKKILLNGYKTKVDAISTSQGLDKSTKEQHKQMLKEEYERDLDELEQKYQDKINAQTGEMLPKDQYKKQVAELKEIFKRDALKNKEAYKALISSIEKPDYKKIIAELAVLKVKHLEKKAKLEAKNRQVRKEMRAEINNLPKKAEIDYAKREQIKKDYQAFLREQKAGIRDSRSVHYNKENSSQIQKMQMIFQDPISSLNPRMTIGEIVSEGLVIKGERDTEYINKRVVEVLELVGLAPEYISRYPHEFSGGQRQRIGIARALIMNPSFIIADEPISALDVSIRAQVLNLLTELKEKLDLSILFIAHDLSVVKFFCDRIAVMFSGKIVEMATSEEIFNNPLHPYTKSLLSAVPQPDPDSEKKRQRFTYSPAMHDYSVDKPELREITTGHFVYCNEKEFESYKKSVGDQNA